MEKLTDAQRAKAMLLGIKSIQHGFTCTLIDGTNGAGFYVEQFYSRDDMLVHSASLSGTAWANADDLLNALAAPEKHNCEWRN